MKRISKEEKQNILNRYKSGESVASISMRTEIPRSTIYGWIKAEQPKSNELPVNKMTINNLERTGEKQKAMVEVLQKAFDVESIPIQIRLSMLEELYSDYNVHVLCDALKVPRGTFYNHIKRNKRDNTWYAKRREELREQIEVIYHESRQIYGAKKIAAVLKERGIKTSEVMVRELMTDMGLISIREDAKDYYDKEKKKRKNYLNQQFHASRPNEVWVSDNIKAPRPFFILGRISAVMDALADSVGDDPIDAVKAVFVNQWLNAVLEPVIVIIVVYRLGDIIGAFAVFAVAFAPLLDLVHFLGVLERIEVKRYILRHFPRSLADWLPASINEQALPLSVRVTGC